MIVLDNGTVRGALVRTINRLNGIDLDDMSIHWGSPVLECDLDTVAKTLTHFINMILKENGA